MYITPSLNLFLKFIYLTIYLPNVLFPMPGIPFKVTNRFLQIAEITSAISFGRGMKFYTLDGMLELYRGFKVKSLNSPYF